jgi:extracellular elastinolytic metalloproteinase
MLRVTICYSLLAAYLQSFTVTAYPAPQAGFPKGFPTYHAPTTIFEVEISDPKFSRRSIPPRTQQEIETIAQSFVATRHQTDPNTFIIKGTHTSTHNGISHVYLQETIHGLPIANSISNVNIAADGSVISAATPPPFSSLLRNDLNSNINSSNYNAFGSVTSNDDSPQRLVPVSPPQPSDAILSSIDAVLSFGAAIGSKITVTDLKLGNDGNVVGAPFALNDIPARQKYYLASNGQMALVYDINVEQNDVW